MALTCEECTIPIRRHPCLRTSVECTPSHLKQQSQRARRGAKFMLHTASITIIPDQSLELSHVWLAPHLSYKTGDECDIFAVVFIRAVELYARPTPTAHFHRATQPPKGSHVLHGYASLLDRPVFTHSTIFKEEAIPISWFYSKRDQKKCVPV